MKTCSKCKIEKVTTEFTNDKSMKDGLAHWCKVCRAALKKARYEKMRAEGTWIFTHVVARAKALENLGGKCVHCSFSDPRALQIDHINGGGKRDLYVTTPQAVYRRIANGDTIGYQLLCATCNWVKRVENQEHSVVLDKKNVRRQTKWRRNNRTQAVEHLGGICVHCKFDDVRVLQIDHIEGNGAEERRTKDRDTVLNSIANGFTEGYQLLCPNCNWIKRFVNEEGGSGSKSLVGTQLEKPQQGSASFIS